MQDEDDYIDDESIEVKVSRIAETIEAFASQLGVHASFRPYRNPLGDIIGIELTDLFAQTPGMGNGTLVMNELCRCADENEVGVFVMPGSGRNREFYERFGFDLSQRRYGSLMYRPIPLPVWFLAELAEEGGGPPSM